MTATALLTTSLVLALGIFSYSQELPDKIRGYKVQNVKVAVKNQDERASTPAPEVLVVLSEPTIMLNGLLSAAIEVDAEITILQNSGKVDFVTFHDFRVNGISVEVEEYNAPFSFKKGVALKLPKPVRLTIGIVGAAKAVYEEWIESKREWSVTGSVYVFGKFKKYGFSFKRVVPVKIDMKIRNPLAL